MIPLAGASPLGLPCLRGKHRGQPHGVAPTENHKIWPLKVLYLYTGFYGILWYFIVLLSVKKSYRQMTFPGIFSFRKLSGTVFPMISGNRVPIRLRTAAPEGNPQIRGMQAVRNTACGKGSGLACDFSAEFRRMIWYRLQNLTNTMKYYSKGNYCSRSKMPANS